jgi:Ni,Fe-hydrogenase III large subunit
MNSETDNNQVTFNLDGEDEEDDELLETPDEIQQGLDDIGIEAEGRHDPKVAETEASEFGVDDREEEAGRTESEQGELFYDVEQDQQTLGGESATRCKWK